MFYHIDYGGDKTYADENERDNARRIPNFSPFRRKVGANGRHGTGTQETTLPARINGRENSGVLNKDTSDEGDMKTDEIRQQALPHDKPRGPASAEFPLHRRDRRHAGRIQQDKEQKHERGKGRKQRRNGRAAEEYGERTLDALLRRKARDERRRRAPIPKPQGLEDHRHPIPHRRQKARGGVGDEIQAGVEAL